MPLTEYGDYTTAVVTEEGEFVHNSVTEYGLFVWGLGQVYTVACACVFTLVGTKRVWLSFEKTFTVPTSVTKSFTCKLKRILPINVVAPVATYIIFHVQKVASLLTTISKHIQLKLTKIISYMLGVTQKVCSMFKLQWLLSVEVSTIHRAKLTLERTLQYLANTLYEVVSIFIISRMLSIGTTMAEYSKCILQRTTTISVGMLRKVYWVAQLTRNIVIGVSETVRFIYETWKEATIGVILLGKVVWVATKKLLIRTTISAIYGVGLLISKTVNLLVVTGQYFRLRIHKLAVYVVTVTYKLKVVIATTMSMVMVVGYKTKLSIVRFVDIINHIAIKTKSKFKFSKSLAYQIITPVTKRFRCALEHAMSIGLSIPTKIRWIGRSLCGAIISMVETTRCIAKVHKVLGYMFIITHRFTILANIVLKITTAVTCKAKIFISRLLGIMSYIAGQVRSIFRLSRKTIYQLFTSAWYHLKVPKMLRVTTSLAYLVRVVFKLKLATEIIASTTKRYLLAVGRQISIVATTAWRYISKYKSLMFMALTVLKRKLSLRVDETGDTGEDI